MNNTDLLRCLDLINQASGALSDAMKDRDKDTEGAEETLKMIWEATESLADKAVRPAKP